MHTLDRYGCGSQNGYGRFLIGCHGAVPRVFEKPRSIACHTEPELEFAESLAGAPVPSCTHERVSDLLIQIIGETTGLGLLWIERIGHVPRVLDMHTLDRNRSLSQNSYGRFLIGFHDLHLLSFGFDSDQESGPA